MTDTFRGSAQARPKQALHDTSICTTLSYYIIYTVGHSVYLHVLIERFTIFHIHVTRQNVLPCDCSQRRAQCYKPASRIELASSPGPSQRGEKGLVHTDCACANLYPDLDPPGSTIQSAPPVERSTWPLLRARDHSNLNYFVIYTFIFLPLHNIVHCNTYT